MASAPPDIPGLSGWKALARGGFATVWEVKQDSLNRLVAIKVDQRKLDTETEQRRFLREAGAAGRLSGHPGIVTVHDAGILRDSRPYLVMELCPGGSLTRWLAEDNRQDQRTIRDVGVRIADALAAAHERGVLHRDVKPANILIDAYGHAGLADFGLAALPDPGLELSETIEAITPAYAPPEAFQAQPPTEFGDVFSLAATIYALLSGRPPRWSESTTPSVPDMLERQHEPIEPIPGVDPGLMTLLLSAMATEPADRPTAAQLRDDLAALPLQAVPEPAGAARGWASPPPPISDQPTGRLYGAGAPPRRRALAGVVIVLVLAAVVAAVLFGLNRPGVAADPRVPSATASDTPTPSATPSVSVPAGFVNCTPALGGTTFCATTTECWSGVISVADVPAVATPRACDDTHVYQTFAAGRLGFDARRQSQLDRNRQVRKVCTDAVVNPMLAKKYRRGWEILVIGPQRDDEDYYRCLFGHGDRSSAYTLTPPG